MTSGACFPRYLQFLLLNFLSNTLVQAAFNESLVVSPLEDGHVLISVEFAVEHQSDLARSGWQIFFFSFRAKLQHLITDVFRSFFLQFCGVCTANDFVLFPKPLGQLIHAHGVEELHVSLTGGRWRQEKWGLSPLPTITLAPLGAEVIAWFRLVSTITLIVQ